MFEIKEISDHEEKSRICENILRKLPNWFGVEEGIVNYVKEVARLPFYAAFDTTAVVGFAALKPHNSDTSEICVMGILKEYHRQGIGRLLVGCCEQYCETNGMEFLTVKTLDGSRASKSYDRTRSFYLGMGFKPLEVFPTIWDESNPCLFMAKHIPVQNGD